MLQSNYTFQQATKLESGSIRKAKQTVLLTKNDATVDIQQLRRIVEYGQQFTYLWGT